VLVGLAIVRSLDPHPRTIIADLPSALLSGCVALYVVLTVYDWVELPWTPLYLGIGLALLAAHSGLVLWLQRGRSPRQVWRTSWSDLVAAAMVALFGLVTVALRSPFSDFVYHWGLKAQRFVLARGVDWSFLAHPANGYTSPDYPHLWTDLFATPAIFAGRFDPNILMLWSPLFLAAFALEVRSRLAHHLVGRAHELGVLAVITPVVAFSIGHFQSGSADLPLLLALFVAVFTLQDDPPAIAAARLGLAVAFAAGLKLEGGPLAILLVALLLVRGGRALLRSPARLAALLVPSLLVVVPWSITLRNHALFQPDNRGPLVWQHWDEIATSAWQVISREEWSALPLLLLAAPLLLLSPRARFVGIALMAALGFYAYLFLCAPVDVVFLVLSSLPRLLLHLLPIALAAMLVALAPRATELVAVEAAPATDQASQT
jgi:hypothetical protein